jgi:hypothetical protein
LKLEISGVSRFRFLENIIKRVSKIQVRFGGSSGGQMGDREPADGYIL